MEIIEEFKLDGTFSDQKTQLAEIKNRYKKL
jgi:hypothetical protein